MSRCFLSLFLSSFANFFFVRQVDDVVMVNVRAIAEMGAYVYLLEYNNIEGMILLSELSRRRIRSINKLIRVGKTEPVVVIRVDKEKGKHPSSNWRILFGNRLQFSSYQWMKWIFGVKKLIQSY